MSIYTDVLNQYIRNPQMREALEKLFALVPGAEANPISSVAFVGNDMVFTLLDQTTVTLAGAKTALAGAAGESLSFVEGTPVNAKGASIVMTIGGVAVHGEKVTIGDDVLQFAADAAQTVDEGALPIDITSATAKAQGTLSVGEQPAVGDYFTIGTKKYTIVPEGTGNGDGDVEIGTDVAATRLNIVAAINGSDGFNLPSEVVSAAAFVDADCVVTALVGGVAGNSIVFTENLTGVTNEVDGTGTLGTTTPGTDCSKGDAKTALLAALQGNAVVEGAAGAGDTLTITALVKGVSGNSIAISETMANGSFAAGATHLAGGVNGTVGEKGQMYADASYIYRAIDDNTIADANWRRVTLGTAY